MITLTTGQITSAILGLAVGNVIAGVFISKRGVETIAERIFFQTWAILVLILVGGS